MLFTLCDWNSLVRIEYSIHPFEKDSSSHCVFSEELKTSGSSIGFIGACLVHIAHGGEML